MGNSCNWVQSFIWGRSKGSGWMMVLTTMEQCEMCSVLRTIHLNLVKMVSFMYILSQLKRHNINYLYIPDIHNSTSLKI